MADAPRGDQGWHRGDSQGGEDLKNSISGDWVHLADYAPLSDSRFIRDAANGNTRDIREDFERRAWSTTPLLRVGERTGRCVVHWAVGAFPIMPRAAAAFSTEGAFPAAGRAGPREQGVQWGGREHHNPSPVRHRRPLVVAVDRLRQLASNSSEIGSVIVAKLLRRSGRVEMKRPAICLRYGGGRVITGWLCGVSKVLRLCFASV
jgi:hypothetical protein